MSEVFDFQKGRSIKGVNPQAVGEALTAIRAAKGTLIPADVVEAARNPDSPMHAAFTWDDSEAAHMHRLSEARRLIVSIRVLNSPIGKPVQAFVNVKTPDHGRSYVPTVEAMNDDEMRARVLAEVRSFVEGLERKWSHLVDVSNIVARLKDAATAKAA